MPRRRDVPARTFAIALALAGLALPGCDLALTGWQAEATDEWVRSYPLSDAGRVEIENGNGAVEVTASSDGQVHVRARRRARAGSDAAAKELLGRISIRDSSAPDKVSIETTGPRGGMLLGGSAEVRYDIQVPPSASLRVRNTNGRITIEGLAGTIDAETTNGGVEGRGVRGAVRAETTNGGIDLDLDAVADDGVDLETTNGGVEVRLPDGAKADLSLSCVNGGIDTGDLAVDRSESSRRNVEGRLNGGGPRLRVSTTNGGVRVSGKSDKTP